MRALPLCLLALCAPPAVRAQGVIGAPDPLPEVLQTAPDTLRPPVSPMGAFWRSILIPGWGQAASGRRLAGAIFLAVEGAALGMTLKADREVTQLRDAGSARIGGKRQEREDWLVILAFNHLFAGLEAFAAAHLWDFPGDLRVRRVPGGLGAELRLPLRPR